MTFDGYKETSLLEDISEFENSKKEEFKSIIRLNDKSSYTYLIYWFQNLLKRKRDVILPFAENWD